MHRSGEVAIPAHVLITQKFEIVDHWSDSDAKVVLMPSQFLCAAFFDKDRAPNTWLCKGPQAKLIEQSAKDVARVFDEELKQSRVGDLLDKREVLMSAKGHRRKAMAEKARDARTVATEGKKKARRVSLE